MTTQKGTTIRLPADLHDRLAALTKKIPGSSINSLGVEMIRDIIRMSETESDERTVPQTVILIDALRATAQTVLKKAKKGIPE